VAGSPLAKLLNTPLDPAGRVEVAPDLTVPGSPNVFVIGDLAKVIDPRTGKIVPSVAQGAIQMGEFVGRMIARRIQGQPVPPRKAVFHYVDKGSMATIGRGKAVVSVGRLHFGGFIAWLTWAVVHAFYLFGLWNQLTTLLTWLFTYKSYARGVRLITGNITDAEVLELPLDPRLRVMK
jgi:NADH:ubiquinone reductase (H+-translocating)